MSTTDTPPTPGDMNYAEAYHGAREDLAIWKRRALAAEAELRSVIEASRRLVSELNDQSGPTQMGEPAQHRDSVFRYIDAQVHQSMSGFYKAFNLTQAPLPDKGLSPPRIPLTDEQMMAIIATSLQASPVRVPSGWRKFARAIEAAHGIGTDSTLPTKECAAGFEPVPNSVPGLSPRPTRQMSDREWAAQPANLREGCTVHVPGVGDI